MQYFKNCKMNNTIYWLWDLSCGIFMHGKPCIMYACLYVLKMFLSFAHTLTNKIIVYP